MPAIRRLTLLILLLSCSMVARAQDQPRPQGKVEEPARTQKQDEPALPVLSGRPVLEFKEEIKPLPPVAIPDDPPPHEGAMFDLPITIAPPDHLIVEVLEALPGRPITGERMIRPDGTISLGFYGVVNVRGLTLEQTKVKILIHLRKYLIDEVLGLVVEHGEPGEEAEMPNTEGIPLPGPLRPNPFDLKSEPFPPPEVAPPVEKKPETEAKPVGRSREPRPSRDRRTGMRRPRRPTPNSSPVMLEGERLERTRSGRATVQDPKPEPAIVVANPVQAEGRWSVIPPADSQRIFVDIVSYNSQVYYVEGDVSTPGRLPWTGNETVRDALDYAGGFVTSAEPNDIHLFRPARGGKPAKDYKIDLNAINMGVAIANLQLFPNDRLVIGRNQIVDKTAQLDRAESLINGMLNSMLQYSFAARSMGLINSPPSSNSNGPQVKINGQNMTLADPPIMTSAQRDTLIKQWAEFLWSISSKEGGAMLDEKAFREALMKKLTPAPESK